MTRGPWHFAVVHALARARLAWGAVDLGRDDEPFAVTCPCLLELERRTAFDLALGHEVVAVEPGFPLDLQAPLPDLLMLRAVGLPLPHAAVAGGDDHGWPIEGQHEAVGSFHRVAHELPELGHLL